MDKVIVDQSFWELFPDAQVNILYANGIDNHDTDKNLAERREMLANATKEAGKFLTNETFRMNSVVDQWRKAYQQFKKKKGSRASIEALLKRVNQGRTFDPIDPMVDIYNSISMTYGVPVGMEDRDKIKGAMHLGQVDGGQAFRPVGADEDEPTLPGEVCYYDDEGAVCRCLNWRDAQRTMLTADSQNVVAVIESVNAAQAARADEAMEELRKLINQHFGVKPPLVYHLIKDNPVAEVPVDMQ
ncbi:phenylalanine--tRNA ligase beta subunit-related protein [Limosilactobacillus pontis]|uniref:B3/B4 domain-containing protein n=1 Tax=Limosilactobacillus pontis TaxID=35787 RepID=UPI0025A431F1|nr:phenylalanine--tRNA ligase beta subunit-related protein [Limosilactobacillus pontis]MDM8331135.1 phenylalanine--tRNA ligase beta subunit-related protein [Limosilactobacillus pontis]